MDPQAWRLNKPAGAGTQPERIMDEGYFQRSVRFIPDAMAIVYDLASFTDFANQPDAARFVPQFLNIVMEAVSSLIDGGTFYWEPREFNAWPPLHGLIHRKFLGDGELLLFENDVDVDENYIFDLLNRCYNLQLWFSKLLKKARESVPLDFLPPRIRFGIARGSLLELPTKDAGFEYVGVCVNLASRLQSYCQDLNFLASSRVVVSSAGMDRNKYLRATATKIRGFGREGIIADADSFKALKQSTRTRFFET